jgi:hypothetical protein
LANLGGGEVLDQEGSVHAVVNHLPIKEGADWSELIAKLAAFEAATRRSHPALLSSSVIKASDTEAILVAVYRDRESLDSISRTIAAPWFAENVRPYLSGPVSRSVGEIVAGSGVPAGG